MAERKELEQQVGRLIIGRLPGLDLPAKFRKELERGTIGGITLFKENASTLEQLAELVHEILESSLHVPVISVDQEGGAVQRFDHVLTPLPSAMALAASNDEALIETITRINAHQLQMLGFNCLLAPVLDVLTNPMNPIICTRGFSDKPGVVSSRARTMAGAITKEGLVPVGKHFPGHGATREDSHMALAVNKLPVEKIWKTDIAPFRACLDVLPVILTAHVWVEGIDEEPMPASLSRRVTQSVLREYLGFKGIVMTDDMTMKGITDHYGLGEAVVRAVEAGADLILACGTFDQFKEAHEHLLKAVVDGRVPVERITESLKRIKEQFGKRPKSSSPSHHKRRFEQLKKNVSESAPISAAASTRGVAIVRGRIPELLEGEWIVVAPKQPRYALDLHKYLVEQDVLLSEGDTSSGASSRFHLERYELEPSYEDIVAIAERCRGKNVVFLTFRCLVHENQMKLGQMIADQCKGKLAICTDTPFDTAGLPDWPNVVASHDPSDQAMKALAQVLFSGRATGVCPVQADPIPV